MHHTDGHPAWTRWLGLGVASALTILGGAHVALGNSPAAIVHVRPGMNQTELQSVLGPPQYIQVNGLRQAWQYCPNRFFIRFLDARWRKYVTHREEMFITVWFYDGQVEHMRAYPDGVMGECQDFFAAFRWEDRIEGIGIGAVQEDYLEVDAYGRSMK